MRGIVYVATEGIASENGLGEWVNRGLSLVLTLPRK
jgi:hypothetical protein